MSSSTVDGSISRELVWARTKVEESLVSDPSFSGFLRTAVRNLRLRQERLGVVLILYECDHAILVENHSS